MTTDITLQRLRDADPAVGLPRYDDDELHLLIEQACSGHDANTGVAPSFFTRRRAAVLTVAASLVLGLAGPIAVSSITGSRGASSAAAAVLDSAAAITSGDPPVRPGQYWRITRWEVGVSVDGLENDDEILWRLTGERTTYVPVDGNGRTVTVETNTQDPQHLAGPVATPPREWLDRTPHVSVAEAVAKPGWQAPTPSWLASLPRDVTGLRDRLYADARGHGASTDAEVVVLAADVMRSGLVPADLRSSLFRVLRTVPGVDITDQNVTLNGRHGVGIGRTESVDEIRQEIVVDPADGTVIGERMICVNGDGKRMPAGTVTLENHTTRDLVDAIPAGILAHVRQSTGPAGGVHP